MALSNGTASEAGSRSQTRQMTTQRIVPVLPLPFGQAKRKINSDTNNPKPDIPASTPTEKVLPPYENESTSSTPVFEEPTSEVASLVTGNPVKPVTPIDESQAGEVSGPIEEQHSPQAEWVKEEEHASQDSQVKDGEFAS